MSAWPCPRLKGPESRACQRCPVSCSFGPLGPPHPEDGQGGARSPGSLGQTLSEPSAGGRKYDGHGARGTRFLHRPRKHGPGGERRWHCFLPGSWWRGKLFVTTLLPSHLLVDKRRARTAEWKAMLPEVAPLGAPPHWHWSSRPCLPGALTRRCLLPLTAALCQGREGNQKDYKKDLRIRMVSLLLFCKSHILNSLDFHGECCRLWHLRARTAATLHLRFGEGGPPVPRGALSQSPQRRWAALPGRVWASDRGPRGFPQREQ